MLRRWQLTILTAFASTMLQAQDSCSLRWRAREAKKLGKTDITVPAPSRETAGPEPLDDALAHTTLVLAKFLERATTHDDDFVITWRKYRILEKFSSQPIVWTESDEPFLTYVPASLLPIAPDEFVMAEPGGTDVIDGITVTMRPEQPALPETHPLLLFLILASSGAVAGLNYGPTGAFWIDQSEIIHAIDESSGLGTELFKRTGGNLSGLRALIYLRGWPR